MNTLLDKAIEELPWFRRNYYKLMLRNPTRREAVLAFLTSSLYDDHEFDMQESVGAMTSYNDPIEFNPDNLAKILELIMKYLPQILAILLPLFKAMAFITLTVSLSQGANAQCLNGLCANRKAATVIAVAYVPVQQQQSNYQSVGGDQQSHGYGSAGSAQAISYGSAGSSYTTIERVPLLARIRSNIMARRAASYQSVGYGSSGTSYAAVGYGSSGSSAVGYGSSGSAPVAAPPCCAPPATTSPCSNPNCACVNCACPQAAPVMQAVLPVVQVTQASNSYSVALASATYRAMNGIKGHSFHERGRTAGVGWSTSNPQPATCFGRRGEYVSIRGHDGWYSTSIL